MSFYNFKQIQAVPTSTDFIDIVLSKTQRKTPTVVHKQYKISRIRGFYMKKVKFTQQNFAEKLSQIINDFPKLTDIHPFYSDLINVLYDRDHYKLALGQINTARHLIENVGKDYIKLLKFGDSLYRCKQLKKAALGRMATIMKRQKDSLAYLEEVRQHLGRLPSIDPNTRTLLVCGYPNVGKSSFINKITRAEVEVQPYAFTTKSLFVGHSDYKYLRWQVIDTPGILDHPLEEMNTIEMQSITAMAHIRACVLFFMDLSEQCGYSLKEQCALFSSIKPLFANKPTVLVINKIDVRRLEDLSAEERGCIDALTVAGDVPILQLSCFSEEGVMDVRNKACDILLASRVGAKMKTSKMGDILNKLHLAVPAKRDNIARPATIPGSVVGYRFEKDDPERPKLEKDIELEMGGAGVYNVDLNKRYDLKQEDWKYDVIPEIMEGKNVADFVDPEIEARLEALEREEEEFERTGKYNVEEEMLDSDEEAIRTEGRRLKLRKKLLTMRRFKGINRLPMKAATRTRTSADFATHLDKVGLNPDIAERVGRSISRKRKRDSSVGESIARQASLSVAPRGASVVRDRSISGLRNMKQKVQADKIKRMAQRIPNLFAKRGESDRHIACKRPKHLLAGKRSIGKTDRR